MLTGPSDEELIKAVEEGQELLRRNTTTDPQLCSASPEQMVTENMAMKGIIGVLIGVVIGRRVIPVKD